MGVEGVPGKHGQQTRSANKRQQRKHSGDSADDSSIVLLDGAFGSNLYRRGVPKDKNFLFPWSVEGLVWNPQPVLDLHCDYISVGCDVITTNAFRTNRSALETTLRQRILQTLRLESLDQELRSSLDRIAQLWGDKGAALTHLAKFLAHAARRVSGASNVKVAGNLTTMNDCYRPEDAPTSERIAKEEHSEKIRNLVTGLPIDILLLETMNTLREARWATEVALEETRSPIWVSFTLANSTKCRLPASNGTPGDTVQSAVSKILELPGASGRVKAILFNCAHPRTMEPALIAARGVLDSGVLLGAYANTEKQLKGTEIWDRDHKLDEKAYAGYCIRWADAGARIIGGCCGTNPRDMLLAGRALANRGFSLRRIDRPHSDL